MESANLMERLFDTMENGTAAEKFALLETIREKGDTSLITPLVNFLEKEKSRAVKDRILIVLDVLVPLSGYRNVDRMLRSPDPQVRNGIVEIIRRSDIPIINFLEKLSEDEDKDVRKFVIDALSAEKSEKAVEIIRRRLHDTDINIVYTAIEYLGNFNDRESVDTIETLLLESDNLMVICAGLEALARIGNSPRKQIIMDTFMKETHNFMTNFPLLRYLGTFGTPESFPYIENLVENNPDTFTKEIIDAVEGIMQNNHLEELPANLRAKLEAMAEVITNNVDKYAVAKLLADAGESKSEQLQKARKMLDDPDLMIKLCGIELLADTGGIEDIKRLEDIAEHTDDDELLEAIGDAVMKIEKRTGD